MIIDYVEVICVVDLNVGQMMLIVPCQWFTCMKFLKRHDKILNAFSSNCCFLLASVHEETGIYNALSIWLALYIFGLLIYLLMFVATLNGY